MKRMSRAVMAGRAGAVNVLAEMPSVFKPSTWTGLELGIV
jgi:hypothetical protein